MKDDDPTYVPGSCSRKGQPKTQDAPDLEFATPELTQGYRILQALTGISRYFLKLPDHTQKGMRDYYDVISKPVCFKEIQRRFADGEYKKISEFLTDVRCLLLNCYTYFGPNDIHTQKALKVEEVLKQRIALLPEDLRTVFSLEGENAQTFTSAEGVQSLLLQSVIGERSRRECERKQRLSEELRKEEEGKERDLVLWEQERLLTGTDREKMESMWELAVIGHFVALSLEQLNITTISMFEVERMVFMPQASKSLSVLMTTLLSAPQRRSKLHTKPPMPYRTWTKKLELKVSDWYKTYIKSDKNANFMFEKFGIEHQFWKILGTWNPLEEYEFHELTVYQRVVLIKAVCDYILQNHKILRDAIAEKRHEFGKCLGQDRSGAKFFYFPQLLDQSIRIYRQSSEPKSWMDRDLEYTKLLAEKCNGSTTLNGKRRGRKPKNRGKIAKEKNHSDIAITRKSLRNTPKPVEISVSVLASSSNQANESSNCGTTGCESEAPSYKSGLEVLGNKHSSPQTGHSASSINENLSEETQHEPSISASCGIDTHLGNEPNSSQTSVSEDVYTSYNESHHNKCSSECSDSVSSCNLGIKHVCDGDHHNVLRPRMVENKNNFTVDQSECVSVQNMPSYQTQNIHEDSNTVIKVSKTRRPLYNPHWLEPNPDDFRLVVDTVEGVRQLLTKYPGDDGVVMSRQSNNKSGKGCRPLCEVKLFRQLSSLLSDLDCVEIKILLNTRSSREKMYKEWVEFSNRPTDCVDPDEAFWNNEKEPAETSECQTPETHLSQTSAVLEDTELPQTPQVTDPGDTAEDTPPTCASGMKLRRRTATKEKYDGLDISDVSSDVHSDDSDNWVVPKSRKNRPKKRKRIISPALHNSSKKKGASEECPQQPLLNQEEAFPKMVQDSTSKIKIQDGVGKSPAKKRRVRKNLFPSSEASSSEPSHQLQQEKCQTLVNSATNKSSDIAVCGTLRNMLSVSQTGKITARDVKTKALLPLQSYKVGDVNRTVKNVEKGCVVIDAVDLEMEKDESFESVTQNVEVPDGKVQAGKPSSQNFVDVSEKPRQTHGQETVPGNCPSGSNSNIDYKAPSSCVHQGQKNKTVRQSLGNVQAEPDLICISDNSDDEIEWLCSKYNPKLDYKLDRKKQARKKEGQSAVKAEGGLTPKQTNSSPESDPCVQRNIPTCGMEAASSTGSSVSTHPNQSQTQITNSSNNTTYLTHNSTTLHDNVEEDFPVTHNHVGTHTVAENQDSVSEAVLAVQPSGSSYSVSGNSVLQTESIEHVQSHIPGLSTAISTAKTVPSPIPSYSTPNNRDVPLRKQVTLTQKQTHSAQRSDPCVQRMIPTSEMEAAVQCSVNTLPNQSQTLVTNPHNNTTYLTHNSTILHDKVEEDFPVKHNHMGTHTVAENQDRVSEAVLTVQPSGSSYSVSGNSVLQSESTEHVQSHIPGLNTAKTVLSPVPSYSTQNNQNVPVRTPVTSTPSSYSVSGNSVLQSESTEHVQSHIPGLNTAKTVLPPVPSYSTQNNQNVPVRTPVTSTPSSYSVSGNSVLQSESTEHVQSHIPGLNTAKTVLSPVPSYSTQNNQNVPVRTPVTSTPSSYSVSGNSVLQSESTEHVQSHIPGLSTAKTVLSPVPSYSTPNNRNVPIRTQVTLTPKQTHSAQRSYPCVQRMVPTSELEVAASTGSSVNTLPNQSQILVTNLNNNTTYLNHNSTTLHDKVEEEFPVKHNDVGTHTVAENQDRVSEAVLAVQPSGSSYSVSGNSVLQIESIEHIQSHIPGLSTAKTVLSPVLSYSTQNNQNVPVRTQVTLTPKQTHNLPKYNPCVQRMVPTSEVEAAASKVEAAASTDSSVNTLPQYFQTPVTNPDNNTIYLTHNSTVIHDNIEEGFPVDHRNVGIHTATENQHIMNEAVLSVQPSGSSHHVLGNSMLQTESVEHVQRHIPELSTANTVLSPLPLSSPQNNPNIPVHHSVAAGETITSVQHSSSTSNGPVHKLQIEVGGQVGPSNIPASQGSNVHPYIFILGSSPGTSVIQVTTDTTNRPSHARTQDISSDAQSVRTNSPGFNSSTSSRIPYPQLTQTKIPTPQLVDPLVDRARNCHLPVYQTNDNLPVAVRSSHFPSVQTRNPGFSSTPAEHPHTPITHTQHPHSRLANTHVPGILLSSHTPEGQTRIPGTLLTKTRNSVATAVQTRSPGIPVAHTSSAGTMLGKTRSPGTPVAHTSSAGTVLGKTRSPGTPVAHTSSSGIVLGKTRSPGTPVAHTSSYGTVLGKTRSPGTPVAHTSSSGIVLGKTRSPGTPVVHTHNSGTVLGKTRSPSKICISQASSSGVSAVQARNSGSSLFRAQTPVAHVNPGARLPHGRGHPSSRPERDWTDAVQQRDQTARLVVIPGDDNVSRYGLVFPSGAKVILTPEQVAEIRAANGGLLTSHFGM